MIKDLDCSTKINYLNENPIRKMEKTKIQKQLDFLFDMSKKRSLKHGFATREQWI